MFTMAKIRNGSTYLSEHLTANDYYNEQEQIQGIWWGLGAKEFGLDGLPVETVKILERDFEKKHGRPPSPEEKKQLQGSLAFERLRLNLHPITGAPLTPRTGTDRIAFFDFQCSAQKSVSVMSLVGGDSRIKEAHEKALKIAFNELESFASCRLRKAGDAWSQKSKITGNLCAAVFHHDASRSLDPQIHSHCVVANVTWDGKNWVALESVEMVRAIRYAGKVYQNQLAVQIQKLGYEIEVKKGQRDLIEGFEIKGISKEILERFSKRRADIDLGIEAFVLKNGRQPTRAEIATITKESRGSKLQEITTPEVLANQRSQLSPEELASLDALRVQASQSPPLALSHKQTLQESVSHLFERESVLQGHHVLAEALNLGLGEIDLETLKKDFSRNSHGQMPLEVIPENPLLSSQFSSRELVKMEFWAVEFVNSRKEKFLPFSLEKTTLEGEQFLAAQKILESKDQVCSLRGVAGAGKTYTLKEISRLMEKNKNEVFFMAPTKSAVDVLKGEGFKSAETIQHYIKKNAVPKNSVIIIDEAGMISTRDGVKLLQMANEANSRILFVGDSRQHSSVEAGDFYRVLESYSKMTRAEIKDIRRQTHQEYNQAIREMASGNALGGLKKIDALGWIKEGSDYIKKGSQDWLEFSENGTRPESCLCVSPTWEENFLITDEIRSALKEKKLLGASLELQVNHSLQWTEAQKQNILNYEKGQILTIIEKSGNLSAGFSLIVDRVEGQGIVIGKDGEGREYRIPIKKSKMNIDIAYKRKIQLSPKDQIIIRRNDKKIGLVNGQILTVEKINSDGSIETSIKKEGKKGEVISEKAPIIPASFRDFSHGYVITSHKSQGRTAQWIDPLEQKRASVVVIASKLDAKAAYVSLSRGRDNARLHTASKEFCFSKLKTKTDRLSVHDVISKNFHPRHSRVQAWKRLHLEKINRWYTQMKNIVQIKINNLKQKATV